MNPQKTKETTKTKKPESQQGSVSVSIKDLDITTPKRAIRSAAFALCIRQLLQNWRQGTVGTKGRSDISFSNKKPWKQKGTGRARAGTAASPLWRSGGVVFGPSMRTRTLKISQNLRKGVLNNLFWDYVEQGNVHYLDWAVSNEKPSTTLAYKALKQANMLEGKTVLFLTPNDALHYASFANIPQVQVLFFDQPNAYDLAKSKRWIVLNKDKDAFKEMVSSWI